MLFYKRWRDTIAGADQGHDQNSQVFIFGIKVKQTIPADSRFKSFFSIPVMVSEMIIIPKRQWLWLCPQRVNHDLLCGQGFDVSFIIPKADFNGNRNVGFVVAESGAN